MAIDLDELAARARERMEPGWNELREQRVLAEVRRAPSSVRRSARIGRWTASMAVAAAVLLAAAIAWPSDGAAPDHRSRLELEDGSVCVLESGARLSASERSAEVVRLVQTHGRVRYEVSHRPERTFEVLAAPVTVRVRGTRFVVDVTRELVTVSVEEGRVEVLARSRIAELTDGETLSVPRRRAPAETTEPAEEPDAVADEPAPMAPTAVPPAAPEAVERDEGTATTAEARAPRRVPARVARRSARPAEPVTAAEPSGASVTQPAGSDPGALLAEADAHRRAGRQREAAAVLERFLLEHDADVRAPSAAFTLGRVRRQLGEHAAAANAFARAYSWAPDGPLAEDSLAYEALSWAAAGESPRAVSAAQRYLDRYPMGLHARQLSLLTSP